MRKIQIGDSVEVEGRLIVAAPKSKASASTVTAPTELLDMLADSFVKSGYDLKALVRLIASSKAYDRSSLPNASNGRDRRNFARFYAKRLPAEVLLDALNVVAGVVEPRQSRRSRASRRSVGAGQRRADDCRRP